MTVTSAQPSTPATTTAPPTTVAPSTTTPAPHPTTTAPKPARDVIVNGGFEHGARGWAGDTAAIVNYGYGHNRSVWNAWLGGHDRGPATTTISQQLKLDGHAASLKFFSYIYTTEQEKKVFDSLTVKVLDEKGATLGTALTLSNVDASTGYVQRTADLTPYVGRTVTLQFQSKEDDQLATYFLLDDIALTVN